MVAPAQLYASFWFDRDDHDRFFRRLGRTLTVSLALHVVVLLWCSTDGGYRIPVAFRLWRPKRSCAPAAYQTKLQLAARMLTELVAARLPFQYLVMDTHYTAGWFTRLAGRLGICWVGTLPPKITVVWGGRRRLVAELAGRLPWRGGRGLACARPLSRSPRPSTRRCG